MKLGMVYIPKRLFFLIVLVQLNSGCQALEELTEETIPFTFVIKVQEFKMRIESYNFSLI